MRGINTCKESLPVPLLGKEETTTVISCQSREIEVCNESEERRGRKLPGFQLSSTATKPAPTKLIELLLPPPPPCEFEREKEKDNFPSF